METQALTAQTAKYANHYGWSDVEPYEIVRVVSPKCLEVRPMDAKQTKESIEEQKKSFAVGGFMGHTDNSVQRWEITSNPEYETIRIRLHKDGKWYHGGMKFKLSDKPRKFYDYNF